MDSKKYSAVRTNCDVANRFRITQNFLKHCFIQNWWRRQILVRLAAAIAQAQHNRRQRANYQQK